MEILNNLSLVYADMGDYKNAVELCQRSLDSAAGHYSPEHPDYLNYKGNYGVILRMQGLPHKQGEARKLLKEVIDGLRDKRHGFSDSHVWLLKFSRYLH